MSDGLGVTTYSFNVLNQMASRSRNGRTVSYRSTGLLYALRARGIHLSLIHISEAHETVLDLVCRLLLEKKTNKNPRTL